MAATTRSPGTAVSMLAAAAPWLAGCFVDDPPPPPYHPPCTEAAFAGDPLGSKCGRLIDAEGRVVVLRGVNARVQGIFDVTWDPTEPPLMPLTGFTDDDAREMRAFGFDALRLPARAGAASSPRRTAASTRRTSTGWRRSSTPPGRRACACCSTCTRTRTRR